MNDGKWPMVKLGDVLKRSDVMIDIAPDQSYQQVTVRLWGKGVALRAEVNGSEIAASRQYLVRTNQFILSRIDARNGAFGLVPDFLDGAVVSNDFPVFDLDEPRIMPAYLEWLSKTSDFVDLCKAASEGTTNRVRLKEELFLATEIPLPPLEEQRRIVGRIDALAARIAEARGLRERAVEETEKLLSSSIFREIEPYINKDRQVKLETIALSITDGDHQPPPKAMNGIPFIFISNITTGTLNFDNCNWVSPEYFANIAPQRIPQRGDILYTAVGATYGTPCIVDTDQPFCFQRHIAIIKPNSELVETRFLKLVLSSSYIYDQATRSITGSAQPTVPLKGIRNFNIPLPSLVEQRRIVAYLDGLQAQVEALKAMQAATAAELDALLPSVLDRAFRGEL
jgi:type I restriction enzyme, S subunit